MQPKILDICKFLERICRQCKGNTFDNLKSKSNFLYFFMNMDKFESPFFRFSAFKICINQYN